MNKTELFIILITIFIGILVITINLPTIQSAIDEQVKNPPDPEKAWDETNGYIRVLILVSVGIFVLVIFDYLRCAIV